MHTRACTCTYLWLASLPLELLVAHSHYSFQHLARDCSALQLHEEGPVRVPLRELAAQGQLAVPCLSEEHMESDKRYGGREEGGKCENRERINGSGGGCGAMNTYRKASTISHKKPAKRALS